MCGVCVLNRTRFPLLEIEVVLCVILELKDGEGKGAEEGDGEEKEVEGEVEVDRISNRFKVLGPPFRPPIA